MNINEKLILAVHSITEISNCTGLDFNEKLQKILLEIVRCLNIEKGSIMTIKGLKSFEVVASTRPELIGVKQAIYEDSPTAWVVKNKKLLYVDSLADSDFFNKKYNHYKKSSFLLAPILSNNRVIAIISATEKIGADSFSNQEQMSLFKIAGYVISAIENHRLTQSLRKSKKSIQEKNKKLKKLEATRTELFNMLIHDLKGPISEVVANLDILTYTVEEDENLEYVRAARTGCDTLYGMVSDLLDIDRLEDGSLKLFKEKIKPDQLIKETVSRLHGSASAKELCIVENCDSSSQGLTMKGDRRLLIRVLQNLLSNAIYHSPEGGRVEAGCECIDESIRFYVKDNGPGVPFEFQDKIFDKYVQVEKKNDGRIYTTGLGLTFCKMAVTAHKGKIDVESDGRIGSRFKFELPLGRRIKGS